MASLGQNELNEGNINSTRLPKDVAKPIGWSMLEGEMKGDSMPRIGIIAMNARSYFWPDLRKVCLMLVVIIKKPPQVITRCCYGCVKTEIQGTPWWHHQMETFSALLAFVWGIHRSPVNSLHKGQWWRDLMFSLICAWINRWVNNGEAGDLRCHHAHYDVTVLLWDHKPRSVMSNWQS